MKIICDYCANGTSDAKCYVGGMTECQGELFEYKTSMQSVVETDSREAGIMRVQIKNESYLKTALETLENNGWDINRNNISGDCLYIWTNGSHQVWLSHWTADNPYLQVDETNFAWFLKCI